MNSSADIIYIKDGLINIIEKLLNAVNNTTLNNQWQAIKSHILSATPFEVYLESQKIQFNNKIQMTPTKVPQNGYSNGKTSSKDLKPRFNYHLLDKIKIAEEEIRNNTKSYAQFNNRINEQAISCIMTAEQFRQLANQDSIKSNQIKDMSIYVQNQSFNPNYELLGRVDQILNKRNDFNSQQNQMFYKIQHLY